MPGRHAGADRCCTPAASSAAAATRSPAACTASASRSSTRCRAALIVEVKNRGHLWRQTFSIGVPDGELEQVRALEPGESTGTTVTYWASEDIFETTDYSLETITTPDPRDAFLNKGLEIVVRDERPAAEEVAEAVEDDTVADDVDQAGADAIRKGEGGGLEQVFKYDRGLVDYVEHLNRRKTGRQPDRHHLRGRDARRRREPHEPRGRDAVEHHVHRVGAHLRQHHQHPRGRHPRGGLPRGAHLAWSTTGARSGA